MPITTLPDAPSRSYPDTFRAKADALMAALPTFVTEANALEVVVVTDAGLISPIVNSYQGAWSEQTGAANTPYAVSHDGSYWQLASNLGDVTLKEPGVDVEWIEIQGSLYPVNYTQAASPVTLTAALCKTYMVFTNTGASGACTLNLPAGAEGMVVNILVTAAQDYIAHANGTETITYLDKVTVAGGSLKAAVIGHMATLTWNGTGWNATINGESWYLETT